MRNNLTIEEMRKVLVNMPEGATGFINLEDDEYNHFVMVTPELSELNKHKYWHVDALTGQGRWALMDSKWAGFNMLECLITIDSIRLDLGEHPLFWEACNYVKKNGWDLAINILKLGAYSNPEFREQLKRLVESWELVSIHNFENSKEIVANAPSDEHFYSWSLGDSGVRDKTVNIGKLRKAIADVELFKFAEKVSNYDL